MFCFLLGSAKDHGLDLFVVYLKCASLVHTGDVPLHHQAKAVALLDSKYCIFLRLCYLPLGGLAHTWVPVVVILPGLHTVSAVFLPRLAHTLLWGVPELRGGFFSNIVAAAGTDFIQAGAPAATGPG